VFSPGATLRGDLRAHKSALCPPAFLLLGALIVVTAPLGVHAQAPSTGDMKYDDAVEKRRPSGSGLGQLRRRELF
jgi:hypothetical protein